MKFQRRLSEPNIVFPQEQPPRWSLAGNWWHRLTLGQKDFWANVLKLATGSSEPFVQKRCDRNEQTSYTIYDPVTQQEVTGLSETEARVWLEQRYYQ